MRGVSVFVTVAMLLVASTSAFGLRFHHQPLQRSPFSWPANPSLDFHPLSPWRLVGDDGWFYDNMRLDDMWLEHPHHRIQSQRCINPQLEQVKEKYMRNNWMRPLEACYKNLISYHLIDGQSDQLTKELDRERNDRPLLIVVVCCSQEKSAHREQIIDSEKQQQFQREQRARERLLQDLETRKRQLQEHENKQRHLEAERQSVLEQYEQTEANLRKDKKEQLRQYKLAEERLTKSNVVENPVLDKQRRTELDTSRNALTQNESSGRDKQEGRQIPTHRHHQNKASTNHERAPHVSKDQYNRERINQNGRSTNQPHTRPQNVLVEHSVPGYDPDDITIDVANGKIKIQGHHICSCSENCIDREFTRVFQTSPQIDGKSVQATLDKHSKLKLIGSYTHIGQTEGHAQVKVQGVGIPQSSVSREDKIKCLQQKGGIKLKKVEKRVPQKMEETYKYDYEIESQGYHSDYSNDDDIDIDVEY